MIDESLDQRLSRLGSLKEGDISELKESLRSQTSLASKKPDLRERQRSKQRHKREERLSSASRIERFLTGVKEYLGFGHEYEFSRQLSRMQADFSAFEQRCERIGEVYEQREKDFESTSEEFSNLQAYFGACQNHYEITLKRKDTLEVEVEQLVSGSTNGHTPALHEKREQLYETNKRLNEIYLETEEASRCYIQTKNRMKAYDEDLSQLRSLRADAEQQRSAVSIQLDRWKLRKELDGGVSSQSLDALYEGLAISIQDMEAIIDRGPSSSSFSLDAQYAVSLGIEESADPLVDSWRKQPAP